MQAVGEIAEFPSFAKRAYPCWVMSLTNLAAFEELPEHEECIGKLEELLPDSTSPSCAYSFFISQNWEGGRPGPAGHGTAMCVVDPTPTTSSTQRSAG